MNSEKIFEKAFWKATFGTMHFNASEPGFFATRLISAFRNSTFKAATLNNCRTLRALLVVSLVIAALPFWAGPAAAQDRRQNAAGEFDFYVLSLSWSPSFCESASERGRNSKSQQIQCGGRPYSFVVHGLWPQYERGFPNYCQQPSPRLDRNIVSSMLDLMPAPGLIFNEWDKHGTCSGVPARAYFETVRKARASVKIPDDLLELSEPKTITPAELEDAFVKANPGLSTSAISVTCDGQRLSEVRICMSKDLQFRACEEIDRRACRRDKVTMPPVRASAPRIAG